MKNTLLVNAKNSYLASKSFIKIAELNKVEANYDTSRVEKYCDEIRSCRRNISDLLNEYDSTIKDKFETDTEDMGVVFYIKKHFIIIPYKELYFTYSTNQIKDYFKQVKQSLGTNQNFHGFPRNCYDMAQKLNKLMRGVHLNRGRKDDSSEGLYSLVFNFILFSNEFGIGNNSAFYDLTDFLSSFFNIVDELEYESSTLSTTDQEIVGKIISILDEKMVETIIPRVILKQQSTSSRIYILNDIKDTQLAIGSNIIQNMETFKKQEKKNENEKTE